MRFLFLLFIAVPIIEITVLIQVGQWIGALWTIALVVLTAFIGINMLRVQGLATLNRANWRIQSGQLPAQEMVEGIFLAIGGALLLTPGFITDAFGFMCLLPFTRGLMAVALKKHFVVLATGGHGHSPFGGSGSQASKERHGTIIEGEFENHTEQNDPSNNDRLS
ncbi:MAG: FxsA family protein [Gammaproteobacteria bacterium]|jgi:UPF0716 protein FxsA|nr:FxsA family protein [Gammaproteobacteria bacterium]